MCSRFNGGIFVIFNTSKEWELKKYSQITSKCRQYTWPYCSSEVTNCRTYERKRTENCKRVEKILLCMTICSGCIRLRETPMRMINFLTFTRALVFQTVCIGFNTGGGSTALFWEEGTFTMSSRPRGTDLNTLIPFSVYLCLYLSVFTLSLYSLCISTHTLSLR